VRSVTFRNGETYEAARKVAIVVNAATFARAGRYRSLFRTWTRAGWKGEHIQASPGSSSDSTNSGEQTGMDGVSASLCEGQEAHRFRNGNIPDHAHGAASRVTRWGVRDVGLSDWWCRRYSEPTVGYTC
jgi:hypothetical protein